ncbi:hypothetical protein BdWA1_000073 [Babesia duncani]|uniref:Uncharacterized protein n=1 Tax=Babesia duncani TaxID=323732 RepID=A0AAD9PM36_9APIC|nr:hypothetical protein BdWA1_000073 [Babesia duncani]
MAPKFVIEAPLLDLLKDEAAAKTCKDLLEYSNLDAVFYDENDLDNTCKVLKVTMPSPSLIAATGKGHRNMRVMLDALSHAALVVESHMQKQVLGVGDEIVATLVNSARCMDLLQRAHCKVAATKNCRLETCQAIISAFNKIESQTGTMRRLHEILIYCMDLKIILHQLQEASSQWRVLANCNLFGDYGDFVKFACKLGKAMNLLSSLDNTDLKHSLNAKCQSLLDAVIREILNCGVWPCIRNTNWTLEMERQLEISIMALRHLQVYSTAMLQVVDTLVRQTSETIDLKALKSRDSESKLQLVVSYASEYMATYCANLNGLEKIVLHSNPHVNEFGDVIIKDAVEKIIPVAQDKEDPCELYTRRCVTLLGGSISHLTESIEGLHMLAPVLISLGYDMIPQENFQARALYFKLVCQDLAKAFLADVADRIMNPAQAAFRDALDLLQSGQSTDVLASQLLVLIPSNLNAKVMREYLDQSGACPILCERTAEIVAAGLQCILVSIKTLATRGGLKLVLNDGSTKVILKPPSDAHRLNAALHELTRSLLDNIEPCATSLSACTKLQQVIREAKEIELIQQWVDNIADTLWHTASYIGEKTWTAQQVVTVSQHILRIITVMRQLYMEPLLFSSSSEILERLCKEAVLIITLYTVLVWPMEDSDKVTLGHAAADVEFEILEMVSSPRESQTASLDAIRRLVLLGDEEVFDLIKTKAHAQQLGLDPRALALHLVCRLVATLPQPPQESLYMHLGYESIHAMLRNLNTHGNLCKCLKSYLSNVGLGDDLLEMFDCLE